MGEFQNLKQIDGLEMSSFLQIYMEMEGMIWPYSISAKTNYATLTTSNSITSEFIPWNNNSHKKVIKGLLVNTKTLIRSL